MSKIPCRICASCGFYHDLSVTFCGECGKDVRDIPAVLTETKEIPEDRRGKIDETLPVFAQKCIACGTLNFTADKTVRVRRCRSCSRVGIGGVEPIPYESSPAAPENTGTQEEQAGGVEKAVAGDGAELRTISENIAKCMGPREQTPPAPQESPDPAGSDAEGDDEAAPAWEDIIGDGGQEAGASPGAAAVPGTEPAITLTAVRYGELTFTVKPVPGVRYMLGRSANQSGFLCRDPRVGNEHCYICFRDGSWYVTDNHSQNGTFVNSRDIGLDGTSRLNDGDELVLGHKPDSIAFRVSLGTHRTFAKLS